MLFELSFFPADLASLNLGLICEIFWTALELLGPMDNVDNLLTS